MDIEEALSNPVFYILTLAGEATFILMLMMLKGMGNGEIMPFWVKISTLILIPVIAFIWASFMDN